MKTAKPKLNLCARHQHMLCVSAGTHKKVKEISLATGMKLDMLIIMMAVEWEAKHCKEDTIAGKSLLHIREEANRETA